MKVEDNYSEVLDLFSAGEIFTVCKNTNLDLFLEPIQDKCYEDYTKKLGRLDKKTALVQKQLPAIAFKLYKKGEKPFRKAIAIQLESFRKIFTETIGKWDTPVTLDDIRKYDSNEMTHFYYKLLDDSNMNISPELFFVILKMQGINIEDAKCSEISMKTVRDIERKHSLEIEEKLKQQAKKMHAEFAHEKQELKKKYEDVRREYKQMKERLEVAEQRNKEYENISEKEKDQYKKIWFSEYEKELEQRKLQDENERKQNLQNAQISYKESLDQLEKEFEIKKKNKEKEYQDYISAEKEKYDEIVRTLTNQVANLKDEMVTTENQLENIQNILADKKNRIVELERKEADYFDSFEQRILSKKIDSLLFEKYGMERNAYEMKSEKPGEISNSGDFVLIEEEPFSEKTEHGADVVSLEDLFEDFKCNISVYFDDDSDITATVLSGVMNHLSIIAVDCICNRIAQSLSALLDCGKPFEVNISTGCTELKPVVDAINCSKSQVVCIKGVLDNYDENMFRRLSELCHEKILFFSISNIDSINMMTKSIMNNGIVIDAEDKMHFTSDEAILVNNHSFEYMLPEFDSKKSREIFKRNFGRLVSKCLIKKPVALRYCFLLQTYIDLTNSETMGDIVQKVIINACNFEATNDETLDVLNKSGFTVWSM